MASSREEKVTVQFAQPAWRQERRWNTRLLVLPTYGAAPSPEAFRPSLTVPPGRQIPQSRYPAAIASSTLWKIAVQLAQP